MLLNRPGRPNVARADKPPSALKHAFQSLATPNFRMLWFGMLFNMASMQVNIVSRSWLAYRLSGSALVLGIVAIARGLPQLILSPVGGLAADRFDKRKLLVAAQLCLSFLALVNAVLVQTGLIRVWQLIALGLLQGTVFPFTMPTRQALIPQLVTAKDLPNAVAMDSAGRNLNRVAAPSLAGVLIAWNPTVAFYTVAVLYLASALTLLRLPPIPSTNDRNVKAGRQMLSGFRYMIGRRRLVILMGMAFLAVILGMPYQQMLPVFQSAVLHVGPERLGFMYAAVGAGALVGSLVVAYRSNDPRRQTYQMIAGIAFGVFLIPFALSHSFLLSLGALILIGLCNELFMTINRTLVVLNTDRQYYGRVMGTYAMTFSLMPIATLPVGAIVDGVGAPATIAVTGALLTIAVIVLSVILPRIWHKDLATT